MMLIQVVAEMIKKGGNDIALYTGLTCVLVYKRMTLDFFCPISLLLMTQTHISERLLSYLPHQLLKFYQAFYLLIIVKSIYLLC